LETILDNTYIEVNTLKEENRDLKVANKKLKLEVIEAVQEAQESASSA
jgi:hypothetical protein